MTPASLTLSASDKIYLYNLCMVFLKKKTVKLIQADRQIDIREVSIIYTHSETASPKIRRSENENILEGFYKSYEEKIALLHTAIRGEICCETAVFEKCKQKKNCTEKMICKTILRPTKLTETSSCSSKQWNLLLFRLHNPLDKITT